MRYACLNCDETFSDPEKHTAIDMVEAHGSRAPVTSLEYSCPFCGHYEVQDLEPVYCIDRCGRLALEGCQKCAPCLEAGAKRAMKWAEHILETTRGT